MGGGDINVFVCVCNDFCGGRGWGVVIERGWGLSGELSLSLCVMSISTSSHWPSLVRSRMMIESLWEIDLLELLCSVWSSVYKYMKHNK